MSYLISRALFLFEDGSTKSVVLEDTTKDLAVYKELLIKNNNAEEVFLNYEQENSNDNAGTHFTDYIKPFRFKTSVE